MISKFRDAAIALALVALSWVLVEVAKTVRVARAEVAGTQEFLKAEISDTRAALLAEVQITRADLLRQVEQSREKLLDEVAFVRLNSATLIDKHATEIAGKIDMQLTGIRADMGHGTMPVLRSAAALLDTYQAIPGEVRQDLRPWLDCRGNGSCWPAQITATIGATRATLGQVARSAPKVAASLERSAEASERATDATARALGNVAELTRPLPRWIRYPLQILGPTTPIWAPLAFR